MFVEDLSTYNVNLVVDEGCVTVFQVGVEGWKPQYQDHLRDVDALLGQDSSQ
jgi:hypothetical protein